MWWNVQSVVCCGKTSAVYEMHFGFNGYNWRSSGGNTSKELYVCERERNTFVIRPIIGHQLTTFYLGQVLNVIVRVCVNVCFMSWGGVVVGRRRAVCWEQRPFMPTGSGQCVCARVWVCMQQFDQSDKSTVVVYTLVLTCCADHILSACGTLPTFFSPAHTCTHTHTESPLP